MKLHYAQVAWIAVGIQLLIVEIIALIRGDMLLTDAMRFGSGRWLIWPALFGTLCGHFFGESTLPSWAAVFLIPLMLSVLIRDLFIGTPIAPINHLAVCITFIGLGTWLWGSR